MSVNEPKQQNLEDSKMSVPLGEYCGDDFAIVSGRTNPDLLKKVAAHLKTEPFFLETKNWGNGYPRCLRPAEISFANKKVIIITSLQYKGIGSPVEELELMHDACKSATEIHHIITWFCGKDDVSHSAGHVPTTAWLAGRITALNPKSVNIFDPHQSGHLEYFYPLRRRRFYFLANLIEQARGMGIGQIAATDFSSTKRANKVEEFLKTGKPILLASKDHDHNKHDSPVKSQQLIGKALADKVGVFDDMALSWATMSRTVRSLKEDFGVKEVHAFAAHFDPTSETLTNLSEAFDKGWLDSFNTTNSTELQPEFIRLKGFKVIEVSKTVSELVEALVLGKTTSPMFQDI
jgi:phosphoribosylpyrophosphate synthetase